MSARRRALSRRAQACLALSMQGAAAPQSSITFQHDLCHLAGRPAGLLPGLARRVAGRPKLRFYCHLLAPAAYYMERMVNTRDPARSVFRLSWDSDALWLRQYARQVLGDGEDGLVCFRVRRTPYWISRLLHSAMMLWFSFPGMLGRPGGPNEALRGHALAWLSAPGSRCRHAAAPRTLRALPPSPAQPANHAPPALPQTVLAGVGNLTRRGRASDALPYRAAVAERLGLDEVPVGQEERPVITMLDKDVSALGRALACSGALYATAVVSPTRACGAHALWQPRHAAAGWQAGLPRLGSQQQGPARPGAARPVRTHEAGSGQGRAMTSSKVLDPFPCRGGASSKTPRRFWGCCASATRRPGCSWWTLASTPISPWRSRWGRARHGGRPRAHAGAAQLPASVLPPPPPPLSWPLVCSTPQSGPGTSPSRALPWLAVLQTHKCPSPTPCEPPAGRAHVGHQYPHLPLRRLGHRPGLHAARLYWCAATAVLHGQQYCMGSPAPRPARCARSSAGIFLPGAQRA